MDTHRVVILGGGFGGLTAAKSLRKALVEITMVDRRNFHLFQPLLYQVATGGLSPADIAAPLRTALRDYKNARVLLAEAQDLDPVNRRVILDDGVAPYDTLIVATGARNHYFNPKWARFAPGLKSVEEATVIRSRILSAFEEAERCDAPETRRALLTFIVVGAGPTGVELAGTLGEIANDTLKDDFRSFRPQEARIILVDASERVLPPYPPELSTQAERALIGLGVQPRLGVRVVDIDAEGVTLEGAGGRDRIAARTVIWAAGVGASPWGKILEERTGAPLDRGGRVKVERDLSVPGRPEILVLGDLAHFPDPQGEPLPGVAPVAMQQGRYAARLIEARLAGKAIEPFRYRDRGSLATIGRAAAVADFGRIRFSGLLAWLTWLFVHLMYLVGFQNRVKVFIQWGFHYFSFNRSARLITGEPYTADASRELETARHSGQG